MPLKLKKFARFKDKATYVYLSFNCFNTSPKLESSDCITYTTALAHELLEGETLPEYEHLKDRSIKNSGDVVDTYASAWYSVRSTQNFDDAIVDAINRGGDADTVGAVTGMIVGRVYGTPKHKNLLLITRGRLSLA